MQIIFLNNLPIFSVIFDRGQYLLFQLLIRLFLNHNSFYIFCIKLRILIRKSVSKKKKVTKSSLITNINGFIYLISYFDIKNKTNNYSTADHDVKMINKNFSDITKVNNKSNYYCYLLGDKAYKTQYKFKFDNKII